jgi:hypothetical protein
MNCYCCGQLGSVWKRSKTASGKLRLLMICRNPTCRFEFINFEGQKAKAQPKWSYIPPKK